MSEGVEAHVARLACLVAFQIVMLSGSAHFAETAPDVVQKPILGARATLIKSGWMPRETFLMNAEGQRENQWGDAGILLRAGVVEVEFCTGTGVGYCFYNYRKKGRCLRLLTQGEFSPGEYQPQVIKQTRECPAKEARSRGHTESGEMP